MSSDSIAINATVWRFLKERLDERSVRLKSQYSSRLYEWAKQYLAVGYKRVSLATLRNIFGLEGIKDYSGKVIQPAPLEIWANVKQRALDQALRKSTRKATSSWSWNSPGVDLIGRYRA